LLLSTQQRERERESLAKKGSVVEEVGS
jgi:hypothetical protein